MRNIFIKFCQFLTIALITIFIFNSGTNAKTEQEESLEQAVDSGVTCGYANTEFNQCCEKKNNSIVNIEDKDLDKAIEELKSCTVITEDKEVNLNQCFTDGTANIIITSINTIEDGDLINEIFKKIKNYIKNTSVDKKLDSDIETIIREYAQKYNNLSRKDKLKVQINSTISKDKCIIDSFTVKGFCMRGMTKFLIDIFGDNSVFQSIFDAQDDVDVLQCVTGAPVTEGGNACKCEADTGLSNLCVSYIPNTQEYDSCKKCTEGNLGFWTGFGCIGLSFQGFIQETLFGWGLGLAGVITLLCIIYAAFMLQTSAGNPERIKKARQYLTACITGLLLIVFSILILRIIGVDILRIPGFI